MLPAVPGTAPGGGGGARTAWGRRGWRVGGPGGATGLDLPLDHVPNPVATRRQDPPGAASEASTPHAGIECRAQRMVKAHRSLIAGALVTLVALALGGCAVKHPVSNVVQG